MNILTYSSLYPNNVDPSHGIFVERRLRELLKSPGLRASVVAPVPWFPFKSRIFGRYSEFAAIPESDTRYGVDIHYPRYPLIPKIGMLSTPSSMASFTAGAVRRAHVKNGPISIIDAHYLYPDGVAASRLAERFRIPFIVTARGSDVNLIASMPRPRRMILATANRAGAIIAVSQALARGLADIGVDKKKIHVLPNGVDLSYFCPGDRDATRRRLGFKGTTFISVGALKEAKGHSAAIEALQHIEASTLVVIGAGTYESELRRRVASLELEARVDFTGRLSPEALREHYRAADALLLVSRREGMPNVMLESLACGTPVIAADVGGIGEVLTVPDSGVLLRNRTALAVADAWQSMVQRGIDRAAVRRHAERFSWDSTARKLNAIMQRCASR